MLVAAVVLAAGASRRMGQPKALLDLGGTPLVRAHVTALSAVVDAVCVVVGRSGAAVAAAVADHPGVRVVHNPCWATDDMFASLRRAAHELPPGDLLVQPVDVPPVPLPLVRALAHGTGSLVPRGPDGDGHPVRLGALERERLGQPQEEGLRSLLAEAVRLPWPDPVGTDFDDPAAWATWMRGR